MSSDESDDLPLPISVSEVHTLYPHIWSTNEDKKVNDNPENNAISRSQLKWSMRHKPYVSASSVDVESNCSKLKAISDMEGYDDRSLPEEKAFQPATTDQESGTAEMTPGSKLTAENLPALDNVRGKPPDISRNSDNNGECAKMSFSAVNVESRKQCSLQTRLKNRSQNSRTSDNTSYFRTKTTSSIIVRSSPSKFAKISEDGERADNLLYTTSVGEQYILPMKNAYSNLHEISDVTGYTGIPSSCLHTNSRRRSGLRVSNDGESGVIEVGETNFSKQNDVNNLGAAACKNSSDEYKALPKKAILSPRSVRLAQACFGEKPKRTRLSKIIFSHDSDVTDQNERALAHPKHVPNYGETTLVSDPIVSDTPTPGSAVHSPKSHQKTSLSGCSSQFTIGSLFLDEDSTKVRPPPKKKSPLKQAVRSVKVELLNDDGLWSSSRP